MATIEEIQAWFAAHPQATDSDITAAARQYSVSPKQISDATGVPVDSVINRMTAVTPRPQYYQSSTPTTGYNSFLDNLMSNLNPQGGMMGFDLPITRTATYERPVLSNLNAVREQALADYQARKAAEEKAKNDALTKQLVDAGILTSVGDGMFSVNAGYNGYGPSDTSYSGWSDALAAAGQNSNVAVSDMGTAVGSGFDAAEGLAGLGIGIGGTTGLAD